MSRLLVLLSALGFVLLSVAARLLPWLALAGLEERSLLRAMVTGSVALAAALALTLALVRWRPSLPADNLRLLPGPRGLGGALAALAAGGALFAAAYGAALALGGIEVRYGGLPPAELLRLLGVVLIATALNAAWEEYTFRGWAFSICVKAFGPHPVAIVLGTLFGLAHLLNPSWTVLAIVSVAIAGWLISYTMLAFGDIAVPIGLHVGWNLTQSALTSSRFWVVRQGSSALLSGGAYGLEASLPGMGVTALAAAVAVVVFRRRAPS